MKKITKKILLEEINKINHLINKTSKPVLKEQISKWLERLFSGGEKEMSDAVKIIERSGIKEAEEVSLAFRSLVRKGLSELTAEESLFLANVVRQAFPDVTRDVVNNLTQSMAGHIGLPRVGKLEDILRNPNNSTNRIYTRLINEFGIQDLSIMELQMWRESLRSRPSVDIKIPTSVEIPRPENITKPTELSPIITREMESAIDNELNSIPEGGAFGNPEIPFIEDISDPAASEFVNKKLSENGIDPDKVSAKELLDVMKQMVESNKAFADANKSTSEAIKAGIEHNKTNPPVNPTNTTNVPKPKVSQTLLERVKKIWNADKDTIANYNLSMTALQIASMVIDVYGTDKKFTEYSNPFYGRNLGFWETMGIKVLARGLHGKALFAVNVVLSVVDLLGMGYDLYNYHPERMKKLTDAEKRAAEDKRIADSTKTANDQRLQKLKDIDLKRTADSLKQKYSDDSLVNAIRDKLNPKLDTAGKKQIIDPFKQ
jgi:hypothetical protein